MSRPAIKETDIGAAVVRYFEGQGFEVYPEVCVPSLDRVIDVVATRGNQLVVVECKTSLSFEVIGQAYAVREYANRTFVATPAPTERAEVRQAYRSARAASRRALMRDCIGHLEVCAVSGDVAMRVASPIRKPSTGTEELAQVLTPEMRRVEPGTNRGGHLTPFRLTMMRVREAVVAEPGLSVRQIVKRIDHHYAHDRSAIASLTGFIRDPMLRRHGLETRKVTGRWYWYALAEDEAEGGAVE